MRDKWIANKDKAERSISRGMWERKARDGLDVGRCGGFGGWPLGLEDVRFSVRAAARTALHTARHLPVAYRACTATSFLTRQLLRDLCTK